MEINNEDETPVTIVECNDGEDDLEINDLCDNKMEEEEPPLISDTKGGINKDNVDQLLRKKFGIPDDVSNEEMIKVLSQMMHNKADPKQDNIKNKEKQEKKSNRKPRSANERKAARAKSRGKAAAVTLKQLRAKAAQSI